MSAFLVDFYLTLLVVIFARAIIAKESSFSSNQALQNLLVAWKLMLQQTNYSAQIPPNYPHTTTNVTIALLQYDIGHVDEAAQTIITTTDVNLWWHDDRLVLDTSNDTATIYPDTNLTFITSNDVIAFGNNLIWIPELNMPGRQEATPAPFIKYYLYVNPRTGLVHAFGQMNERRTCKIKTRYFPFDVQECPLRLAAAQNVTFRPKNLLHTEKELQAKFEEYNQADPDWYETNEWRTFATLAHVRAVFGRPLDIHQYSHTQVVVCPMFLTRKSGQHVINWIITPIVLCASTVVGMYGGCHVVERYSFGGSIVVTMTLMIAELRAVLGVGADGYPILGQMYIGLELTLIVATLVSGIPRRLYKSRLRHSLFSQVQPAATTASAQQAGKLWMAKHKDLMTNYWDEKVFDWVAAVGMLGLQALVVLVAICQWSNNPQ